MHINQAFKLLQQGHLEQARDLCAALIRQGPPDAKTLILMSAIQQRLGDRTAATACLVEAAALQSADTQAQFGIIKALRTIGALEESNRLLNQLDNNQPQWVINQAQNDWQNGQYAEALAGFEKAVDLWPDYPEGYFALARARLRLAEPGQAETTLLQAAERWPDNDEIRRLLAIGELDGGRPDAALEHLQDQLPAQQEPSPAQQMLSALLLITGRTGQVDTPGQDFAATGLVGREFIGQSFSWLRSQSSKIAWFGTNSGLLSWACKQIPAELPGHAPVVECGVYHGFSLRLLSDRTDRPIHGFDSFQGLPETWKPGEPAGSYSTRGRLPATAAHVHLHPGWFEHTLPDFAAQLDAPIALLHVDCDLYSSTQTVLKNLGPKLAQGSLLVFDDFLSYQGYEQHEFRAAHEYFAGTKQQFELVGAVLLGRAVAYRLARP